jgi:hypothetical protein
MIGCACSKVFKARLASELAGANHNNTFFLPESNGKHRKDTQTDSVHCLESIERINCT